MAGSNVVIKEELVLTEAEGEEVEQEPEADAQWLSGTNQDMDYTEKPSTPVPDPHQVLPIMQAPVTEMLYELDSYKIKQEQDEDAWPSEANQDMEGSEAPRPHQLTLTIKQEPEVQVKQEPEDDWYGGASEDVLGSDDASGPSQILQIKQVPITEVKLELEDDVEAGQDENKAWLGDASQDLPSSEDASMQISIKEESDECQDILSTYPLPDQSLTKPPPGTSHPHQTTSKPETPSDVKRHQCPLCPKSFIKRPFLIKHYPTHFNKNLFTCYVCPKSYRQSMSLNRHYLSYPSHAPPPSVTALRHECPDCGKCFTRDRDLTRHSIIHSGPKPFKCVRCLETFAHGNQLASHRKLHHFSSPKPTPPDVDPHQCTLCGLFFSESRILDRHMLTHSRKHTLKCKECDESFEQSSQLICHMVTHTGENPFKCGLCYKSFSDNSYLCVHDKTCGKKRFLCALCNKSYGQRKNFSQHIRVHSSEKYFFCEVCGKSYTRIFYLEKHMATHGTVGHVAAGSG